MKTWKFDSSISAEDRQVMLAAVTEHEFEKIRKARAMTDEERRLDRIAIANEWREQFYNAEPWEYRFEPNSRRKL